MKIKTKESASLYIALLAAAVVVGVLMVGQVRWWWTLLVALGTFAAMSFRTIHTVWYLSKHILHRPVWRFLLKLVCNLLVGVFLIIRIPVWIDIAATTIPGLLVSAIKVSVIVFPVFLAANALLSIRIIKEEIQRKN